MRQTILLAIMILLCMSRMYSQTGTIGGIVRSEEGKPITGALVVLSDDRFTAKTDSSGQFVIVNVPIGRYQLFVIKGWFIPRIVKDLRVDSGKTSFIEVTLSTESNGKWDRKYKMPLYVPDSSVHYR